MGIGASAGGLDAFRGLLRVLPADSGMAFLLVQHLDPTHASMLVELLAPHAAMPLVLATQGARLEPDHIYVIPAGRYLSVAGGALKLAAPAEGPSVRLPFDVLLTSLADQCAERAIGIVLSGTGFDGAIGAKAIKAAGGLVIAQDPDEAEFDGMPRNAVWGGAVDLVLPLNEMPKALAEFGAHRYLQARTPDARFAVGKAYAQIIALLSKGAGHDFTPYKPGTVERRIERRMALNGLVETQAYLDLLAADPAELRRLADDLLINVTRFFRDAAAFQLLADEVFPALVRQHPPDQPVRIWVAGCSSGEEAYSICILLLEAVAKAQLTLRLQIFATDIDADAVATAREGFYPPNIEADVSPERLARFFVREEKGYRASSALRASIVFSVHDLMGDPPFSRLDMVSCRNLLIYLRPETQQKVLGLFHFALRPGGILFLGGTSAIAGAADRFEAISTKERIYRHIGRSRAGDVQLPLGRSEAARTLWARPRADAAQRSGLSDFTQRLLAETYAPASILVGRRHQGVYYFGPTDLYLKVPAGDAGQDVLAAAREGLRAAIRTAIEQAGEQPHPVTVAGRVRRDGVSLPVNVTARAVRDGGESLILLSFVDQPQAEPTGEPATKPPLDASPDGRLREDLDTALRDLEVAIRERHIAEEEVRAINEEAMSVNEEFQTTSQELQTSHEELESLNEELTAVNNQLQEALDDQRSTADDLENILNSSDLATIFLDDQLRIRFFTPAAKALFSVIATDIGRPLADLAQPFARDDLLGDAAAVLSSLVPVAREVEAADGAWYACRALPYRTKDNRVAGVVITFADITARKQAEDMATAAKLAAESANLGKSRFLAAASHDLRQPLQTLSLLNGLLGARLKDHDAHELVVRGGEALLAMSGMLNTLLDINQLEAGVVRPAIIDVPIADLLEPLRTEFAYHAMSKGLGWRLVSSRLSVRTDPRLLDQMVRNLLSNAVKYTRTGRLVLGCRRRGDKLRIEVWDTGRGIPQAQVRAIFEEFHQLDNPARELSRGLGLGLSIVQRLGDLMGHTVDVRSREGRGSVFAIELPLSPAGAVRPGQGSVAASDEAPSRTGAILIVEDDPELREALTLFLRSIGHVTHAAADGAEAIRLVEDEGQRPDLVIVDYNLPHHVSGLEVLARLQGTLGRGLPAIVLTGDISTATLGQIAAKGYEHRTKPVSAEDLARLIQRLLSAHPRASVKTWRSRDPKAPPAIFLVDDDNTVRAALRDLLKAKGRAVEDFASAEDFLSAYSPGAPGVLLVDLAMPGMGGLALLDRLKRDGVALPAIVVTGSGDLGTAVQALRAGAVDFIEKPFGEAALMESIDRALANAPASSAASAARSAAAARLAGLTPRQRQILDRVLAGQPSKVIAADLGISPRTVDAHRAAIMKKSGARSLTDLVRLAVAAT